MKNKSKLKLIKRYIANNQRILDLGSFGMTKENLHEQMEKMFEIQINGIDIQEGENVDCVCDLNDHFSDASDIPYNTIIASEVIEHIENPFNFIRECNKLLYQEGRLIISTPNSIGIPYLRGRKNVYTDDIISLYEPMLRRNLEQNGFKIVAVHYLNNFYRKNILLRTLCWLFYHNRPTLFIVAEKL